MGINSEMRELESDNPRPLSVLEMPSESRLGRALRWNHGFIPTYVAMVLCAIGIIIYGIFWMEK